MFAAARNAEAQAVTPASMDLDVGANYSFLTSSETAGIKSDLQGHLFNLTADLGLPRGFAISANAPFFVLKSDPDVGAHGPDDDGSFHGSLHDFRTDVRRSFWINDTIAVAPQLGISIPMVDYTTQGNSAVGRDIIEGHLGISALWINALVDNVYVAGSYTFSEGQRSDEGGEEGENFAQRHSNYTVQAGYIVSDALEVHGIAMGQQYHDGFDFERDLATAPAILVQNHDSVLDDDFFYLGAGAGYQVSDALSVGGSVLRHVIGNDNGVVGTYVNLYVGYNFSFGAERTYDDDWDDDEDWGDDEEGLEVTEPEIVEE